MTSGYYWTVGSRSCIFLMWDLGVEFYELLIHGPTQAPPTSSIQRRSLHSWLRYYDSVVHKMSPSVPWLVTRSVEALSALTTGQPSAFLFSPQLPLAFHFPLLFSELPVLWLIYPLSSCFIDATPTLCLLGSHHLGGGVDPVTGLPLWLMVL